MVNQHQFWADIRKNCRKHKRIPRVVPAFTIQALQDNTVVAKPPTYDIFKECPRKCSTFRKYYERGLLPITMESVGGTKRVTWKVQSLDQLDYLFYLPMFFDGLSEPKSPYTFIVSQGITELLDAGGPRILQALSQIILPLKRALDTKTPDIVCRCLIAMQKLVRSGNCVGEAIVPYFRQLLPVLNLMRDRSTSCGGGIDYAQQKNNNVADLIQETLQVLEQYGGEDAFVNIKYVVPTYESCVKN